MYKLYYQFNIILLLFCIYLDKMRPYNLREQPKPSKKKADNQNPSKPETDNNDPAISKQTPETADLAMDADTSTRETVNPRTTEQSQALLEHERDISNPSQSAATSINNTQPPFISQDEVIPPAVPFLSSLSSSPYSVATVPLSTLSTFPTTSPTDTTTATATDTATQAPSDPPVTNPPEWLNTLFTQISAKIDQSNAVLSQKIEAINQNLELKIVQCNEQFDLKFTELTAVTENNAREINELKQMQARQTHHLQQTETRISSQIDQRITDIRSDFITDLETQAKYTQSQLETMSAQISSATDAKLANFKISTDDKITSVENHLKTFTQTLFQDNIDEVYTKLVPISQKQQVELDSHAIKITELSQSLNLQNEKHELLEQKMQNNYPMNQPNIYVTCNGNSGLVPDQTLPKFYGRAHNPHEFLNKLRKYYERSTQKISPSQNSTDFLIDIVESSLEQHAARWFYLIKNDIKTWSDFERAFEEKYWNREVQRGIKHRMENEKYRPNGNLTRAEYFVERVIVLKSLLPPMSEDEIVTSLSEHFPEIIQDARRVQNINSIREFELLLQREDLNDAHTRSRNNRSENFSQPHQNDRSHPSGQSSRQHNQGHLSNYPRPNINQNAYQPSNRNYQNSPHPRSYPNSSFPRNYPQNQNNDNRNSGYQQNQRNNNIHQSQNNRQAQRTSSPQHRSPYRNSYNDRNYPTREQHQVCSAVIERGPDNPSAPSSPRAANSLNS